MADKQILSLAKTNTICVANKVQGKCSKLIIKCPAMALTNI